VIMMSESQPEEVSTKCHICPDEGNKTIIACMTVYSFGYEDDNTYTTICFCTETCREKYFKENCCTRCKTNKPHVLFIKYKGDNYCEEAEHSEDFSCYEQQQMNNCNGCKCSCCTSVIPTYGPKKHHMYEFHAGPNNYLLCKSCTARIKPANCYMCYNSYYTTKIDTSSICHHCSSVLAKIGQRD
jgi:hypothetical protein